MTKDKDYWYDTFCRLAWQTYIKSRLEFTKSLNIMNCAKMAINLKYVETVLGLWYR